MKNIDHLPLGFRLPMLSAEVALEVHNFLQIVIQIYEARSGEAVDRYYGSICENSIAATSSATAQSVRPQ